MNCQITLDVGTTNTRAVLWQDCKTILAGYKLEVGVGRVAEKGSKECLEEAVRTCIEKVLTQGRKTPEEVECILASGMVTSNVGLWEVLHLRAPVGLEEISQGIVRVSLPNISAIPFWFIPGVKNTVEPGENTFCYFDMMRGEEVETFALLDALPKEGEYLFVLPGSHTKYVMVQNGRITGCLTTMTGELLNVLTHHTILVNSVGGEFIDEASYLPEAVKLGSHISRRDGLARAAFLARALGQEYGYSRQQLGNYLLGVVMDQDLQALDGKSSIEVHNDTKIILSGKKILCRVLLDLLQEENRYKDVSIFQLEDQGASLSAKGALAVYRNCKKK